MFRTLISADELVARLGHGDWVVVDCRADLGDPLAGARAYRAGHVPGAVHASLERDLSGPVTPRSGRHPLPEPDVLCRTLGRLGISNASQVVAYDDAGGALGAARLWWLLRWLGHEAAAVLDGGFPLWSAQVRPLTHGEERRAPARFAGAPREGWVVSTAEVEASLHSGALRLVDARTPERFRGEAEPIDPVAGRVPGAHNRPCSANLDADGRMLPPARLRASFEALLSGAPPRAAAFYCGSGVSACQNLLAMAHAGLAGARLYAGSWSEWCRDPKRPIETG